MCRQLLLDVSEARGAGGRCPAVWGSSSAPLAPPRPAQQRPSLLCAPLDHRCRWPRSCQTARRTRWRYTDTCCPPPVAPRVRALCGLLCAARLACWRWRATVPSMLALACQRRAQHAAQLDPANRCPCAGVAESVVAFAKERHPDLVVVGSRGMGAAKSALMSLVGLGSVSGEEGRLRLLRKLWLRAAPQTAPGAGSERPTDSPGLPLHLFSPPPSTGYLVHQLHCPVAVCRGRAEDAEVQARGSRLPLSHAVRLASVGRSAQPAAAHRRHSAPPSLNVPQRRPSARSWSPWTTATPASRRWRCGRRGGR